MRNLWTVVSILAVAHVVAIGGVLGWLGASGRLDRERLSEIKELLAESPEERQARLEQEAAQAQAQQEQIEQLQERVRTLTTTPMTAEELVRLQQEAAMAADQRMARAMRELQDLRNLLARERAENDRLAEAIELQRAAFEARIAQRDKLWGQEQFRTAVDTLQGLRPPAAMNVLMAIWEGRTPPPQGELDGKAIVVEYLRAMEGRQRNKVLAEFEEQDPALAAILLERLRTDGLSPEIADASASAKQDPDAP
ncbi:MAG: hypothetical protein KatS3mg103_0189 [Phycisphaerales bacterium]|nr:MAG: hypothetical protein KatS3mg103_0189 [Phycisphaerales bacterium]